MYRALPALAGPDGVGNTCYLGCGRCIDLEWYGSLFSQTSTQTMTRPNPTAPGNGARARRFQIQHLRRAVPEQYR